MIPGDLLSAFPHRQFHTLPGLLDSWAALPNSNPNACMPMQGGSLYHFYDGLWYDPAERRTHDLPCERRTRYRLSQPDTVPRLEASHCPILKSLMALELLLRFHPIFCSHCLTDHIRFLLYLSRNAFRAMTEIDNGMPSIRLSLTCQTPSSSKLHTLV